MKLFKILEERGISNYRICKDLNIPESTLSRLKSNKLKAGNLTLDNAYKIAFYLDLPIEEVFIKEDWKILIFLLKILVIL